MSLLVWIPFVKGNCENYGLLGVETSTIGTIIYEDGKLGKAARIGTGSQTSNGILINSNLVDELGDEYSCAVWIKPTGNHVHYEGAIISSGNWNGKKWAFGVNQNNTSVDMFGPSYNRYINCAIPINEWTHLVSIFKDNVGTLYKNGEYVGTYNFGNLVLESDAANTTIGRETYANGYFAFNGDIQDIRIYNHALSPKEVSEIAKGLVLHYKLDENLNVMNNCYSSPTFNTSAAAGGWSHWGGSGHIGTYGQNTDKNYIFNKSNTYSHWVADGADATKNYLVYQSPAFEGGYRSIQCIAKEENGLPITEDIFFPDWNARDGGAPIGKWTSVTALGNGFYLCKCEGVHQDGSNDLIGFNVKPGYKVYISEAYCENDKEMCSDIFNKNALWETIYDCSGYCNNGELYAVGKNLINKSTIISSYYFNSSGALVSTSGWNCTDYISLKPNTAYIASSISTGGSGTYYVLYDINKKITRTVLITANVNPSFTTSDTERYVRFSIRSLSNELDTAKLEEGTTATDYETGTFLSEKGSPRYSLAINPHSLNSTSNAKAGTAYIRGDCELITPNTLTIAFWAYPRAQGYGSNTGQGIFCFSNSTGDNVGSDYLASAINHYDSKVSFNSADGSSHIIPAITFTANEWHHYAFTYDGQNANAYKDGVLTGTKAFSSATALGSFKYVVLGLSKAGGVWRRNNNTYSDLRVYATCLDIDDIKRLYNTPISLANNGTLFAGEFVET